MRGNAILREGGLIVAALCFALSGSVSRALAQDVGVDVGGSVFRAKNPEAKKKTLAGLTQAAGFVRRELAQRLGLRFVPDVLFEYDRGLDATDRVAQLLDEAQPPSAPDDDGE